MNLRIGQALPLALAWAALACSTSGGSSPGAAYEAGPSSASSSGGVSSSSGGTASSSGGSSSGSSSGSREDAGSGADAAVRSDGGEAGTAVQGPCDIYQSANTPCVAAHSTVRALYGSYTGKLYQVQRVADNATQEIYPLAPGGYANSAAQDAFCAQTNCTITILYDQSPQHNDLPVSPQSNFLPNGGTPALADSAKITMAGHSVYGVYVPGGGTAYRNDNTTGVAKGNQAETMYMVVDGTRYSGTCCFDYGNAEANGQDDGNGTMEAVYWGSDTFWGGKGQGSGPWIAADLENGMFKCDEGGPSPGNIVVSQACPTALAQSITAKFATAMLRGPAANTFTLKSGDAQAGALAVQWDGPRPSPSGYYPKQLQGAIILGTGGDGSDGGQGTFFEGAMTAGSPPDAIDDLIQANIVAAGYGQ